ncbi:MAG: homoserine kinase [Actinomycetota bacterium]
MTDAVAVRVSATVANLGPGFDCLGLALDRHNEIIVERAPALLISAEGPGAQAVPTDGSNLVAQAIASVTGEVPFVRIHQRIAIPFGRGLGSSAAAIIGGLVAGRVLCDIALSDQDLLRFAVAIEGHADNVAPCLFGGVTATAGLQTVRIDPPAGLRVLMCVASEAMSTEAARAALSPRVSRADAVAGLAHTGVLVAALATGSTDVLLAATEDVLHQPSRFELMPATAAVVRALRDRGIAAFLSGAGPSVAAFVEEAAADAAAEFARSIVQPGWDVRVARIDPSGARAEVR